MKSKGEKVNSDKYTITDARRLWMVWWNRNQPDLLNLKAKHHAEGQRAFQQLLTESRNQLRTNEAIERAARAIHDDECACGDLNNDRYGDDGTLYYMDKARIAVTALLGDT